MSKFRKGATILGFALTVSMAGNAFAITNSTECENEGGTMVTVKNSDFCLVPIRPEAYKDEIYDGNQLGVVDCPGNKLNDGIWCMYPVTIREDKSAEAPKPAEMVKDGAEKVMKKDAE